MITVVNIICLGLVALILNIQTDRNKVSDFEATFISIIWGVCLVTGIIASYYEFELEAILYSLT